MAAPAARPRRCFGFALALLAAAGGGAADAVASVSGVCPDGSMFIVQRAESVPCEGAKAVDPMDVPPMKPAYLPRPYGWEVLLSLARSRQ